jgi:hypothetical protein
MLVPKYDAVRKTPTPQPPISDLLLSEPFSEPAPRQKLILLDSDRDDDELTPDMIDAWGRETRGMP